MEAPAITHFKYLDGVRGTAALWVMVGHILTEYDRNTAVLSWTSLAVDVFIIISGFLMVRQITARENREPLHMPRTWKRFWIRRFFRIAPLYYVILTMVMFIDQYQRGFDGAFQYPTWTTCHIAYGQFPANVISHATFIFGLTPKFQRSTALPDWSISLEMQFYALFPFVMIAIRRFGWLTIAVVVSTGCLICNFAFAPFLRQFTLPSILILKMNIFMGGMLIAAASLERRNRVVYLVAAAALMMLPVFGSAGLKLSIDRALLCVGFGILALSDKSKGRPAILSMVSRTFGTLPFIVMADLSYGAYLIHYPVILFWKHLTTVHAALSNMNGLFPALIAIPALTYLLAWIARHGIELPGIEFGRKAVNYDRMRQKR